MNKRRTCVNGQKEEKVDAQDIQEMTLTDSMCQEKKKEKDSSALKIA